MHALPAGSHLHEPQMGFIFINIFIFLFPPLLRALYPAYTFSPPFLTASCMGISQYVSHLSIMAVNLHVGAPRHKVCGR